jgi:uncharacterized oxidoreductase
MPVFSEGLLRNWTGQLFLAAGATAQESIIVANALVEANLAGHDSHGILRVPEYVRWMEQKLVNVGAKIRIVRQSDSFAVVDGDWGFGQVVGRQAMDIGIEKAMVAGVGTVAISQCCHIGRVGDYPMMAAAKGLAALMFVNTHGGGKLVAPFGGRERRLSANPIAVAIPRRNGTPIVVDISTSSIAEGKVRSMLNRNAPVPTGCIIDAQGNATTDAKKFYGPPVGALLPFGGHKGFAIGLVADILAGAISGGGCSRKEADRVGNTFLAFVVDIERLRGRELFDSDVEQLVEYVKSSALAEGFNEILVPGEPEENERNRRLRNGIAIDSETWNQIVQVGKKYGVAEPSEL